MLNMKGRFIACYAVTLVAHCYSIGSFRGSISSCVTFSVQVTSLMMAWTIASMMIPHQSKLMDMAQGALVLYGAIICIVFYGIIVPMNGAPVHSATTVFVDAGVHIILPVLFSLQWYQSGGTFSAISRFWHFSVYPLLYFGFARVISARRGYLIYPFLDNVFALIVVSCVFYGVHWVSQSRAMRRGRA
jgi:hypothetical protein